MKHELQNIISGKSQVEHGAIIQAATHYLKNGKGASSVAQEGNHIKKQEESLLTSFQMRTLCGLLLLTLNNLFLVELNNWFT